MLKRYERSDEKQSRNPGKQVVLAPPAVPMQVARQFLESLHMLDDGTTPKLYYWRGGWWMWRTSFWQEIDDRAVRSLLYKFAENAIYFDEEHRPKLWAPNRKRIGDLTDALSAICILPTTVDQPCWFDERESGTIVAMANGLLDVERQRLYTHTPLFFNQTAVPFDYDPSAPAPKRWLGFLRQLWPDEPAAHQRPCRMVRLRHQRPHGPAQNSADGWADARR